MTNITMTLPSDVFEAVHEKAEVWGESPSDVIEFALRVTYGIVTPEWRELEADPEFGPERIWVASAENGWINCQITKLRGMDVFECSVKSNFRDLISFRRDDLTSLESAKKVCHAVASAILLADQRGGEVEGG